MKVVGKCGHTLAAVNERDVAVRGLLAVELSARIYISEKSKFQN